MKIPRTWMEISDGVRIVRCRYGAYLSALVMERIIIHYSLICVRDFERFYEEDPFRPVPGKLQLGMTLYKAVLLMANYHNDEESAENFRKMTWWNTQQNKVIIIEQVIVTHRIQILITLHQITSTLHSHLSYYDRFGSCPSITSKSILITTIDRCNRQSILLH